MIWTNTILARTKMQTRNLLKSRFIRRTDRKAKFKQNDTRFDFNYEPGVAYLRLN